MTTHANNRRISLLTDQEPQILSFGIATLDELLGRSNRVEVSAPNSFGIFLASKNESTSLCLIGPDGTGKSVLALHLASYYAATSHEKTRILYASTDLSYAKASSIWSNFALDRPRERIEKLEGNGYNANWLLAPGQARTKLPPETIKDIRIELDCYHPLITRTAAHGVPTTNATEKTQPLTQYLVEDPRLSCQAAASKGFCDRTKCSVKPDDAKCHRIAYVDLESSTAGDDWGLINRLLATLDLPESGQNRHLLIIDAVEGLETLGGKHDIFGHVRERRSRIAQILRAAKGKAHVVFIVEEPKENERLPEEFVSDAVIRLRVEKQRDYARRTVEIEKLRGQAYVRGQHDCQIRRGEGSKTGREQENPDRLDFQLEPNGKFKAYFLVTHSLHYLSRAVMEAPDDSEKPHVDTRTLVIESQAKGLCGFGIRYLDDMIGDVGYEVSKKDPYSDEEGLPWGSTSALIGDEGTHKGRVGRAFLAKAFRIKRQENNQIVFDKEHSGVAILLTTQHMDREKLAKRVLNHHGFMDKDTEEFFNNKAMPIFAGRIFCRRLEIHHMTSAVLFHIIHALVQQGLRTLLEGVEGGYPPKEKSAKDSKCAPGRVRFVIDDWSGIQDAYPEIKQDPLFLPFLIFYLKRQGITTLIIDTQPGRLDHILAQESDRELRALVPYHLYTWHVTFFGEKRVAISALPPISDDKKVVVRELMPFACRDEELIVDPQFELYEGFESSEPSSTLRTVPLEVHIFQGDTRHTEYLDEIKILFEQFFGSNRMKGETTTQVIHPVKAGEYDLLRDFAFLQGNSSLAQTLVLQLDEFWSQDNRLALSDLSNYLDAEVCDDEGREDPVEDPFRLFQPTKEQQQARKIEKEARKQSASMDELAAAVDGKPPGLDAVPNTTKSGEDTDDRGFARHDSFITVGYDLRELDKKSNKTHKYPSPLKLSDNEFRPVTDRVPFTVDFGMLLADFDDWRPHLDTMVGPKNAKKKISEIWDALRVPDVGLVEKPDPSIIDWRHFFEACLEIHENLPDERRNELRIFDVDHATPETMSCLVLEIWGSEIFKLKKITDNSNKFVFRARRDWEREDKDDSKRSLSLDSGLLGLIGHDEAHRHHYRRALYRTFLLLNAVMLPTQFPRERFRLKPSAETPNGIASRHWYSTASPVSLKALTNKLKIMPLRLPGHFTTRGDWFLGVAEGSRSRRLGERAIDLLCSRRAQISRLQSGIGLPVRGFPEEQHVNHGWIDAEFRSTLTTYDHTGEPMLLRLNRLWRLGGVPSVGNTFKNPEAFEFYWLFRSRIRDYDRHCRIWSKWLLYAFDEFDRRNNRKNLSPRQQYYRSRNLLNDYDKLGSWVKTGDESQSPEDYKKFEKLCVELVETLRRSTLRSIR